MKIVQEKTESGKLHLEVEATAKEVDKAFDQARSIFAQQMNLQAQPGKTIAQAAEEQFGIKDIDSVVDAQVIDCLIPFALNEKDIVPAYQAQKLTDAKPKRGSSITFTFEVMPKPEYELSSYGPVAISISPFEIDEKEIDAQLAQMAEQYAEYVTDEPRPVREHDNLLISMNTMRDGEPLFALSFESRTYVMNQDMMPSGFDENLLGMEVGETKSFTFFGPALDEKGNEFQEEVHTSVTVQEIQKKVIPAINDAWVSRYMPHFKNEASLRGALREQLSNSRKEQYELYKRQVAAGELSTRFEGKIDDAIYEAMRDSIMNDMQMQLQQQGIALNQFIEQNGGEQQFSMMLMMQTRQNLVEGFSLDALYRHEKMALSEEDIFEAAKSMNPQNPEMARSGMEEAGYGFALREAARRIKANKWLVEHAEITVK